MNRLLIFSLFLTTSAFAQENVPTEYAPDVSEPAPVVVPAEEYISPAPRYITIEMDYLNYLLDTEEFARRAAQGVQQCRKELAKQKSKNSRRR